MDQFDVFVSYAWADRDVVAPFVQRLKQDGFTVWFDIEQMAGGHPVMGQLSDGITNSAQLIACLTDAYLQREFTDYELKVSTHLDPAGKSGRTIPVQFRPLTLPLPGEISFLTVCDLTDHKNYDVVYRAIIRSIRRPKPSVGQADLASTCDAPFQHLDEPHVALFKVRRAVAELAKSLYRREIGELPGDATLELIIGKLLLSGRLPAHIHAPLATVQTYGRLAVGDQVDGFSISADSIAPALSALKVLVEWTFPERKPRDDWAMIWDSLPAGGDGTRLIPGTAFTVRGPQLSRTSLGPRYAGHDSARNEPVSVHLVGIPEDHDKAFFEEMARFMQLRNASIVSPIATGQVMAGDRRLCLYLIMPWIDGDSAQDLILHHGRLPARAAYELCLGIAKALKGFHEANPPIVHGDINPANVVVGGFATVRVLCIARELATVPAGDAAGTSASRMDSFLFSSPEQRSKAPLTPATDLFALRAVLYYLLSGDYPPFDHTDTDVLQSDPSDVLPRLANCESAAQACAILERACKDMPAVPSLSTINRRYRRETGVAAEPRPAASSTELSLINAGELESRKSWPLGNGRMLIWEMGSDTLTILDGQDLVWRDIHPVQVRTVISGDAGRLGVGGWDGAVRYFVDGFPVAARSLDGAVGDLCFVGDDLVAGSWKRELLRVSDTGRCHELLAVERGVHRIAAAEKGDRFAVASLSGGLAIYTSHRRTDDLPELDFISDVAYAASRLVILTEDALTSMRLDGTFTATEPKPGAYRLLPSSVAGTCMLLTRSPGQDGSPPAVQAWLIDEADRHVLHFTLPAGHTLLSHCSVPGRFTVSTSDGCAYWRDGAERHVWPDGLSATLSWDGRSIAVSRPGSVELYEAAP
jgi:eukaryotic-like serine/threonine-protein kinase